MKYGCSPPGRSNAVDILHEPPLSEVILHAPLEETIFEKHFPGLFVLQPQESSKPGQTTWR